MLSEEDLAAMEDRASAATPGPWTTGGDSCGEAYWFGVAAGEEDVADHVPSEADAAFIAAARQDVPALITEVRRLRALLAAR